MPTHRFLDAGIYCLQQTISGTGVFNGARLGYAGYNYSAGGAAFNICFPNLGTDGNAYKFQMDAPINSPSTKTIATFDKVLNTLRVSLRGAPGAIAATASEVVAAINNMERPIYGAGLITNATISAGLTATSLTGGLDPDVSASLSYPKLKPAANINGGLFYFDQSRPWLVKTISAVFNDDVPVSVSIVAVDKSLTIISSTSVLLISQALTTPWQLLGTDINLPLMPGQAILVQAPGVHGTVFVDAISAH